MANEPARQDKPDTPALALVVVSGILGPKFELDLFALAALTDGTPPDRVRVVFWFD